MTNLLPALETTRPREKSGSWTSARYDFQRHIAILKIIELHERHDDYRVGFDYFDDLIILDSSFSPTKIRFLQVKTKTSGFWRIREITSQSGKGDPPRSIIGRMYMNAFQFSSATDMIIFISNASFRFELASGETTSDDDFFIMADTLSCKERALINEALDVDFPPPRRPDCCTILSFERTTLSVHDQRRDVLGRLCEYFALRCGDATVPITALYESLFAEVSRRSGISHTFSSMAEFYNQKTLSRNEIDSLFNRAIAARQFQNVWSILQRDLGAAGYTSFEQIAVQTHCIEYIVDRAKGAPLAVRFSASAGQLATSMKATLAGCQNVVAAALALKLALPDNGEGGYEELQVLAALMVEAYEASQ